MSTLAAGFVRMGGYGAWPVGLLVTTNQTGHESV
jgi:hypothetical protein